MNVQYELITSTILSCHDYCLIKSMDIAPVSSLIM